MGYERGQVALETLGKSSLENGQQAGDVVLLVDDLIATGGTAIAAVGLLRRTGATVEKAAFVIDLPDLGGADKLTAEGVAVSALMAFEGH